MANYKNLIAWQKAHALALAVYRATEPFPARERFGLTQQLRRAALSIPTNIVEGANRKSKKEFRHFLDIALGSQAETLYLLEFASAVGFTSPSDSSLLLDQCDEVGRIIWSLRKAIPS